MIYARIPSNASSRMAQGCQRLLAVICIGGLGISHTGCDSSGAREAAGPATASPPSSYYSAGAGTVDRWDRDAFSQSFPVVQRTFELDALFKQGNFFFRGVRKNTGPLVNNNICQGCHIKDGRGTVPADGHEVMNALLFHLSVQKDDKEPIPDPAYGVQLQTLALQQDGTLSSATNDSELAAEAFPFVRYQIIPGEYPDGTPYQLHQPVYFFSHLRYGDFAEGIRISPRLASPIIGLGLLEAIPHEAIEALADPDDLDKNGISGRTRWVEDPSRATPVLGRFGWKAGSGSVLHQTAKALVNDMSLTNRYFPEESCTPAQAGCSAAALRETRTGDAADIDDVTLASLEFYARTLAVPSRRGFDHQANRWEEEIEAGEKIFDAVGCTGCHHPSHTTGDFEHSVLGLVKSLSVLEKTPAPIAALSNQTIFPYTDLLLHDMGGQCQSLAREDVDGNPCDSGDACYWVQHCEGLADGRVEGTAGATEWKTPPLWGLGLTQTVSPDAGFLHDGRARTPEEAILWHGGEAENAKRSFMALPSLQRQALLRFLNSL